MKLLGQILMWLGFLSGALATVFHLPQAGVEYAKTLEPSDELGFTLPDMSAVQAVQDGWHLIPWTWYGISAAVCLVGVVMIRMGIGTARAVSADQSSADLELLQGYLANLVRDAEKLQLQLPKMAPSKITNYIDDVMSGDFRAFANDRETMVPLLGLSVYADVMTDFAAAERAINRAWSAAADGYVDEAATCVDRAIIFLKEARRILETAVVAGSGS